MSFFTASIDKKAIAENGKEFITKSGIYDVVIKFVSVKVNDHGARSLNFNVLYQGSETTLYGLKLDNNDGSENFQRNIFNKLCVIAGIQNVNDPVKEVHKVGRDQKEESFDVLDQFNDLPVKVNIRFRYSKYNGEIREQREIMGFYREDGATASEIVSGTAVGVQLEKDKKYAENNRYDDGLTIADVEAWKASKSTASAAQASKDIKVQTADNPFRS